MKREANSEEKVDYGKEFLESMEELEELSELDKAQKDSRPDRQESARKKLEEIALNALKEEGEEIDFSQVKDKRLKDALIENGIRYHQSKIKKPSAELMKDHLKDIVKGIKPESLEELALQEPIQKAAKEKDRDLLGEYAEYRQKKELLRLYEAGDRDLKKMQPLYADLGDVVAEKMKERLKAKGYKGEILEIAANIAQLAAQNGAIKEEYVKKYGKDILKEGERKLREYEEKKKTSVKDYMTETLEKLAESDDPEDFEVARGLLYAAAKKDFEKKAA